MGESNVSIAGAEVAGETTTTTQPKASRAREAKPMSGFLAKVATASQLSREGVTFVENIVSEACKHGIELQATKIAGSNYEARVYTNSEYALVHIFQSTFSRMNTAFRVPTISVEQDVIQKLQSLGIRQKLLSMVIITDDQFEDYESIAASMANSIKAVDGTLADMTIGDFTNGYELVCTSKLNDIEAFARSRRRKLPHHTLGIMLYGKDRNGSQNVIAGSTQEDRITLGCLLAYTDIKKVQVSAYDYKYLPTVVVTDIISDFRTEEVASVLIALAANQFIGQSGWLEEFSKFGPNDRNLGTLFLDETTKKPYQAKNVAERTEIIRQHFMLNQQGACVPLFALDLQEGYDIFPGLRNFVANPELIKKSIDAFTGSNLAANAGNIAQARVLRFDGRIQTGDKRNGDYIDTRAVDFMYLVDPKGLNVNRAEADGFLTIADPNDPRAVEQQVALLERFFDPSKIQVLYKTHRLIFDPSFIAMMGSAIAQSMPVTFDQYNTNMTFDMNGLRVMDPGAFQFSSINRGTGFGGFGQWGY